MNHFTEVNYLNFMDAAKIASERGGRLRLSEQSKVSLFCLEEDIDLAHGHIFSLQHSLPMATILTSGLMKGFYLYSLESKRAFRYVSPSTPAKPLQRFTSEMKFDVALSYASESYSEVLALARQLRALDVRTYLLDVSEDPEDPLWAVRFREAAFHSYFLCPVLGPDYLAREGTANELFDLARMNVEHRADEFFSPLVPLVPSQEDLSQAVFSNRGAIASSLDPNGFEWLRTHVLPLTLERGTPWLARFFRSLAKNARGNFDSDFLRCLEADIDWLELFTFSGSRRMARLLIKHPILTYYLVDGLESGVFRFSGLGEPQDKALPKAQFADPVATILEHLGVKQ